MSGPGSTDIETGRLYSIRLQTSCYGTLIPIVYGRRRLSGNLIWYSDSNYLVSSGEDSAKGGGGGINTTNYYYYGAVIVAICEGPITAVGKVWKDARAFDYGGPEVPFGFAPYSSKNGPEPGDLFTLYLGERDQSPWPWLLTHHADKALGYGGTAIMCNEREYLGTAGVVPNIGFEVYGFLYFSGVPGEVYAWPDEVVADLLTDSIYGMGWDAERLGSMEAYRLYCRAAGIHLNWLLGKQKKALEHLADVLEATNSELVWSGGVLKIVPYGDMSITGNDVSYEPDMTPLYDLEGDDFLTDSPEQDPIVVSRTSHGDTYNCFPVTCDDPRDRYNPLTVEVPDELDANLYGLRKAPVTETPCITDTRTAHAVSYLKAQRSLYVRNEYTFRLGWRHMLLEPMDLVSLTDSLLGLDHLLVRIISLAYPSETEEKDGVTAVAENWPVGVATPIEFAYETRDEIGPDVMVSPGDVNAPDFIDMPLLMTNGVPSFAIAVRGSSEFWGGCVVHVSEDGETYFRLTPTVHRENATWQSGLLSYQTGSSRACRNGVLTASLATSDVSLDLTHSLYVELAESRGVLGGTSPQGRDDGTTLCCVDGEFLAYEIATLDLEDHPYHWQIQRMRRGMYGIPPRAHDSGTRFIRMDGSMIIIGLSPDRVGQPLYFKFQSFNIYNSGVADISTCAVYTHTPSASLMALPVVENITLSFDTAAPIEPLPADTAAHLEWLDSHQVHTADGHPHTNAGFYAYVSWDFDAVFPAGLHTGFELRFWEGPTPDPQNLRIPPLTVGADIRHAYVKLHFVSPTIVRCGLRAIFGGIEP